MRVEQLEGADVTWCPRGCKRPRTISHLPVLTKTGWLKVRTRQAECCRGSAEKHAHSSLTLMLRDAVLHTNLQLSSLKWPAPLPCFTHSCLVSLIFLFEKIDLFFFSFLHIGPNNFLNTQFVSNDFK